MDIEEFSEVPFDEYGWQATLFRLYRDIAAQASIEVIGKYKEESADLGWKDDMAIAHFAKHERIFEKINALVIKKFQEDDY